MPATTYITNKILDHICNDGTYTPVTLYMALFNGDPAGAGTEILTAATGGYARQQIPAATWAAAASGSKATSGALTFGPFSSDPASATHGCLMDAATAGNKVWTGALTVAKDAGIGDTISFASGEIVISIT